MTRPTWSTKGRFIGLRVRNVGGTRERIARSGPISTFDTHITILVKYLYDSNDLQSIISTKFLTSFQVQLSASPASQVHALFR